MKILNFKKSRYKIEFDSLGFHNHWLKSYSGTKILLGVCICKAYIGPRDFYFGLVVFGFQFTFWFKRIFIG